MISIGQKGTTIWALQLNINQLGNSFNSHLEKQFCNNGTSSIHGKELPEHLSLHCEQDKSHTYKMFDISAKLVSELDESSGLETIGWENHSWKYLSLIGDERIINLQSTKVFVFSILCCASEGFFNIPNPTKLGRTGLQESDPRKATEIMMLSMESRLNSSETFSKDSQRCSSVVKSMIY